MNTGFNVVLCLLVKGGQMHFESPVLLHSISCASEYVVVGSADVVNL